MSLFVMLTAIGSFFSVAAGLMAYLITYTEYAKHFDDKSKARRMALESAAFMFGLFMLITLVIAFYFNGRVPVVNPS